MGDVIILAWRLVHVPGDGSERVPLDEFCAALGEPYAARVRDLFERRKPRGLLNHGGQVWPTRWHGRWAIVWLAYVDRIDPKPLLERVGLAGGAR